MKSSVDKLEGLARKLNIEIPEEKVRNAFDKVYKGIQQKATIKGFRKGKAPLAAIRSQYKDRVRQDVLQDLVAEGYESALKEHAITPVGYPKIKFEAFEEGQHFHFSAEVEVRPEVTVKKYEGLKIKKEKIEINDEQIDRVVENIRQQFSETVPVLEDRSAQKGDVAVIDFEGIKADGNPLEGGSAQGHELELGSDNFIPGFEEGVEGMKPGENKDINLTFPEDYHNKDIAGKPVTFKVQLKELKKKSVPELNDELAKKTGEYETLAELKTKVREDMQEGEERRVKDDLRDRILKALVEANPVQVPNQLKVEQKQNIIEDVKKRMQQQGMGEQDFQEYVQKWNDDFDKSAEFMIQSSFLVDNLAKTLNLKANNEDIENKFKEYAEQTGIELARIKEYYGGEDRISNLKFQLTEEKVVDYLISKAEIKEVPKDQLD